MSRTASSNADDGAVPRDETEERLVVLREIATLRKIPSLHDVAQVEGVAVPVDDDAFARGHGRTLAEAKVLVQKARARARTGGYSSQGRVCVKSQKGPDSSARDAGGGASASVAAARPPRVTRRREEEEEEEEVEGSRSIEGASGRRDGSG